jgi:hypothetical protein
VPEDWEQLLTGMTSFSFVDCRNTAGKTPTVLGALLSEICFYKIGGERDRYVSFTFATDGKIAYVDPYES